MEHKKPIAQLMTSKWKFISSSFLSKMALILSIFIFGGYHNLVNAIPQESVKTEWVLSEKSGASDQVFSLAPSIICSKKSSIFDLNQNFDDLIQSHSQKSMLTIKIQSANFLDYKIASKLVLLPSPRQFLVPEDNS